MLNKSKIAAAVAAASMGAVGIMGAAQAVNVDPDGTGQLVVLPYYNVNNNFITQINVTNTTSVFKAVKVRFRESNTSADVLDFNLYMSPEDQWTGSIVKNPATGAASISTKDETCTYPAKASLQAGKDFIDLYDNVSTDDVTEGYVEIIEMGDIADGPSRPANDQGLYAEIDNDGILGNGNTNSTNAANNDVIVIAGLEHGTDNLPPNCDVVFDAWNASASKGGFTRGALEQGVAYDGATDHPYNDAYNNGLVAPSGGISAYSILINVATGGAFVAQGVPVANYVTVPQHYQSDDVDTYLLPSLASGDVMTAHILGADGASINTWVAQKSYFDTGAMNDISPNPPKPMGANPFPISVAMGAMGVAGDYFVDPAISGSTDWVVTMPMRKHGVWNGGNLTADLDDDGSSCVPTNNVNVGAGFLADLWPQHATEDCVLGDTDDNNNDQGYGYQQRSTDDVVISLAYWNREEQAFQAPAGDPGFSPPLQGQVSKTILPREANVIVFAREGEDPDSILGSPAGINFSVKSGWHDGWAKITVDSMYNMASNTSHLADLVDGDPDNNGLAPISGPSSSFMAVPMMGFTALEGEIGPGSVGETVEFIRSVDRK